MPTQTIRDWPEIQYEGIDQNEPARKRKKHIRKYSILYCTGKILQAIILAAALCVIIGAAGNAIEYIARM